MDAIESERYRGYLNTPLIGEPVYLPDIEWWEPIEKAPDNHFAPKSPPQRLIFGKRMEWFFKQELLSSKRFEILIENLQIVRNGVTIGELDFILLDKFRQCLVHLEMAFKFYLYDPTLPAELPRWIGPNRRDSLVNKLDKLQKRQFPLLHASETVCALKDYNFPDLSLVQALCFKTMLFLPVDNQHIHPHLVNPHAIAGFWIPWSRMHEFSECDFYLPLKWNWIIDPTMWHEWNPWNEVKIQLEHVIAQKKSSLCWMRNKEGKCRRFFVVWW